MTEAIKMLNRTLGFSMPLVPACHCIVNTKCRRSSITIRVLNTPYHMFEGVVTQDCLC